MRGELLCTTVSLCSSPPPPLPPARGGRCTVQAAIPPSASSSARPGLSPTFCSLGQQGSHPLTFLPTTGQSPLRQGWRAWGLFPLSPPEEALPTTTCPPGRCSSSPKGRSLALLHGSLGRGLCPGPFPTSVPSAKRRFPPFPLREKLRLLHSAARQPPPTTARSPWRRGDSSPSSPRPGDCGWH